jgi:hypothetical protein
LQWVIKGALDVDIGANPSAEGGDEEGVDDQVVNVVDIVSTGCSIFSCFRLSAIDLVLFGNNCSCHLQEQPAFDKKQFVTFMKRYIKNLTAKLDAEQSDVFKKNIEGATKYLLGKLKNLQL